MPSLFGDSLLFMFICAFVPITILTNLRVLEWVNFRFPLDPRIKAQIRPSPTLNEFLTVLSWIIAVSILFIIGVFLFWFSQNRNGIETVGYLSVSIFAAVLVTAYFRFRKNLA